LSHTSNTIMSIYNTKEPLYCIWCSNAEDSPLRMMMDRQKEEGAHITPTLMQPQPLPSIGNNTSGWFHSHNKGCVFCALKEHCLYKCSIVQEYVTRTEQLSTMTGSTYPIDGQSLMTAPDEDSRLVLITGWLHNIQVRCHHCRQWFLLPM
jgi:hypothetical protein